MTTKLMIMWKSGWEQSLVVVGIVEKEILRFQFVTWSLVSTWSESHVILCAGYPCHKSLTAKFGYYRPSWREDISSLIYHLTSWKHMVRGSCNFMGSHYPARFGDHTPCRRGDITFLIWHLTSYDHMMRRSCCFMHGFFHYKSPPCKVWWP